jgi:hypothetical protein
MAPHQSRHQAEKTFWAALAAHHPSDEAFWAALRGDTAQTAEEHTTQPATSMPDMCCWVCGQAGHMAVACRLHPARLSRIHGEQCGRGPCTNACRRGDHGDCGFHWCTCVCHGMDPVYR